MQQGLPLAESSEADWRGQILLHFGRLMLVGGTPLVVYSVTRLFHQPIEHLSSLLLVAAAAVAGFAPWSAARRGSVLVAAFLLAEATWLPFEGPIPVVILCFVTATLVSALVFGRTASLATLALGAGLFFGIGALSRGGVSAQWLRWIDGSEGLLWWTRVTATCSVITGLLVMLVTGAVRRVEKNAADARAALSVALRERDARASAERALKENEERLRRIADATFEGIGFSLDGIVVDANPQLCRMLGYSMEELVGKNVLDLVAPAAEPLVVEALASDGATAYEHQAVRKDGSQFPVEVRGHALNDEGRKLRVTAVRDVSERRRAEEARERLQAAIERAAAEWQRTFDAVEPAVLVCDEAGRLRRLNRAATTLLGKEFADVLDCPISELDPREPWPSAARLVAALRHSGHAETAQVRDPESGRTFSLGGSISEGGATGERRLILVVGDLTRLVQLQESLRHTETMAAMGSLVAGVAHEVRNPLFSISATLDALEAEFGGQLGYAEYASLLRSQVNRMSQLMRDLLDFGKSPMLRIAPSRAEDLLRRAVRSCALLSKEHGVLIHEDAHPDIPVIESDAGRIEQVLQNLVANAIQHSPREARVLVSARLEAGNWVRFDVEDEGQGIKPGDEARLFEPFFSRRKGGTGLGLSIVQRIVEAHGGSVSVRNRTPRGAAFAVLLPVTQQRASGPDGA